MSAHIFSWGPRSRWLVAIAIAFYACVACARTATESLADAKSLISNAEKLERAAATCRQKVASGEMSECQVQVTFENDRLVPPSEAVALARKLRKQARDDARFIQKQLERDQDALRRQIKEIERCQSELAESNEKALEAEKDAIQAGVLAIAGLATADLDKLSKSISGHKGWITRYEKQLARKPNAAQIKIAFQKLEDAHKKVSRLQDALAAGRVVRRGLDAKEVWDTSKVALSARINEMTNATAELQEALKSPALADLANDPEAKTDLNLIEAAKVIDELGPAVVAAKYAKVLGPAVTFADFAVQYGYNTKKWLDAREQILQRNKLTEEQLKGVAALDAQLKRTVAALNECREITR
jgi:hypothetical protein